MGTKMSVAFSVIFTAHVEKQLLHASHFSGRDLLMTYSQYGLFLKPKSTTLLIDFANSSHSTIKFTLVKTDCFDDVSLIRKRWSSSGEHSLRSVVNAVRYVVRMNSRACLCYQRKKLLSRDRRVFSFNFFFAVAYFHFALVAASISHFLTAATKFSCCFSNKKRVSVAFYLSL